MSSAPQVAKPDLAKGEDGLVDPLCNLPGRLHKLWLRVVASTAAWGCDMEEEEELTVRPIAQCALPRQHGLVCPVCCWSAAHALHASWHGSCAGAMCFLQLC